MTALIVSNVVLWIIVLALLAVVLALTRQLGVLHERIAPVGALMLNKGLAVGERVPAVAGNRLLYRDGVVVATLVASRFWFDASVEKNPVDRERARGLLTRRF